MQTTSHTATITQNLKRDLSLTKTAKPASNVSQKIQEANHWLTKLSQALKQVQ